MYESISRSEDEKMELKTSIQENFQRCLSSGESQPFSTPQTTVGGTVLEDIEIITIDECEPISIDDVEELCLPIDISGSSEVGVVKISSINAVHVGTTSEHLESDEIVLDKFSLTDASSIDTVLSNNTPNILGHSTPNHTPNGSVNEKLPLNESSTQLQVTPTSTNQNVVRSLRYTADIRTPDLNSPRRRKECLKIIRHESVMTKSKMRNLQRQNQRLKAKVKTLKTLLLDLQRKNLLSAHRAADLLVCH